MNIFLKTYGCQMNEYDTELIHAILTKADYRFVDNEDDADIVLLNTCSVRDNANRKVYGQIHSIRHRRKGKPVLIGILGCMATNFRTELLENKNLNIDFIAGPDSYKRLPLLIDQANKNGRKQFDVTLSEFETYSDIYPKRKKGINAWIAVMRGCNNFCTFCVVPYTRGRERSRSVDNIIKEVKRLAKEGFKQVTLLGQNVNSYSHEEYGFADLLDEVSKVPGVERIRFTSPHPKDFPDRLLKVVAKNPKVCKHIHLPLQAANNRILEMMNRGYTKEDFLSLVDKVRSLSNRIGLTTDIIVGFPTESDQEFEETFEIMQQVAFDSAFIFKYSERKNTIALNKFKDDISDKIKTQRIVRLNELQKEISFKKNQELIGKIEEVLVEQKGTQKSSHHFQGRTDSNKLVIFPSRDFQIGEFTQVKVTDATPHVLKGTAVHQG